MAVDRAASVRHFHVASDGLDSDSGSGAESDGSRASSLVKDRHGHLDRAANGAAVSRPSWQKLLYIKQDYPDNYVDRTFLQEMRKNVNVRTYEYWTLVRHSGCIIQHGSSVLIFLVIFVWLQYYECMSAHQLIFLANIMTLIGYITWIRYVRRQSKAFRYQGKQTAKAAILFMMTLLGLSPILKTLTEDTSSDTIWALTTIFFLANFAFNDYVSSTSTHLRSTSAIAINAAVFASVLLASRLPTKSHVFGLLSFSVNWFVLFPIWRKSIKASSPPIYDIMMTVTVCLTTAAMLATMSSVLLWIYLLAVVAITFVAPVWFIHLQKYKTTIHGPWDEASLVLSTVTASHAVPVRAS